MSVKSIRSISSEFPVPPSLQAADSAGKRPRRSCATYKEATPSLKEKITYLDPKDRPAKIQEAIDVQFQSLASTKPTEAYWRYNGQDKYFICGINDPLLVKKMIQDGYKKGQKEFCILDIGAGNFKWSHTNAEFIDSQSDLPQDIKVQIIGLRGEPFDGPSIERTKLCEIHNLGMFKIEELSKEFEKRGFDLKNKVDLIVSSFTFRHLVDSVGTFVQTYDLLRPKTGYLLFDGFYFATDERPKAFDRHGVLGGLITQILVDIGASFISCFDPCGSSLYISSHIAQKHRDTPCQIPLKYKELISRSSSGFSDSGKIILFTRNAPQALDELGEFLPEGDYGKDYSSSGNDEKLYRELSDNLIFLENAITKYDKGWKPIRK